MIFLWCRGGEQMPYDIGKKLKEYRNKSKMTVKEVSILLSQKGFKASESTIYSWENGNSQPTPGALLTMCEAYGITNVLEAFGYDGYKPDGSIQPNIDEIDMIEKYRVLDNHGKEMVDFALDKEYERCIEEKHHPETFEKTHLTPVAAHNDDEGYEQEQLMREDLDEL